MRKLSSQERNAMPAREFAFAAQRKEPLEDANHVRNAIARFDQVQGVTDEERDKAWRRIKAAAKRYKLTATGLVKVPHCGKQHKAACKNRSRKTRLKKMKMMRAESVRLVSRCLPNGL